MVCFLLELLRYKPAGSRVLPLFVAMKIPLRSLLLCAGWLGFAGAVLASNTGNDNASNYSAWTSGSNSGTGFNPWSLNSDNSKGGFAGFFLGDSTALGGGGANSGGADINTGGSSFGMYANSNANVFANADRSFNGGALSAGQVFSLDLAVNFRNGAKGINLRNDTGGVIFTFNVTGNNYVVSDAATTSGSFGDYSANSAFHLSFTQTSDTGGTWMITRSGGISNTVTGTYGGDAFSFRLFIGNTDDGNAQNNLYANNLAITGVPEPATWLGGTLVLAVAGWRLRRLRLRRGTAA